MWWGSDREAVVARFGEIGDWNVSVVTSMKQLFYCQKDFNEDISRWDTSNVTNMNRMFCLASSFNQPVEGWNTANVTTMSAMFNCASSFRITSHAPCLSRPELLQLVKLRRGDVNRAGVPARTCTPTFLFGVQADSAPLARTSQETIFFELTRQHRAPKFSANFLAA